jgi:hypothetical protein
MDGNRENMENAIEKIVDDCQCIICVSNKGIVSAGTGAELLSLLSCIYESLIEHGISKDLIEQSFETIEKTKDKKEKSFKSDLKNAKKTIEEIEKLMKEIDNM